MIVEDKKIEKVCSFYVSDFHLEMILVPYIKEKIENKENIEIVTEKDLTETIEILISKMNMKEENKQKILNLGWKQSNEIKLEDKSNIIIIGSEKYINQMNQKVESAEIKDITTIDCYNFNEVKDNINNIVSEHDKSLNTLGIKKF